MGKVKIAAAALILIIILIIQFSAPEVMTELYELLKRGDIEETAAYISNYGERAILLSIVLTTLVNAIGFPPAIIFSTANTLIFGIVEGIIISCIAETIGVTISFILLRFFFRETAEVIISKNKRLQKIDDYSGKNGFKVMLVARMVPYVPSALLNAAGALSKMNLKEYFIASLIGKFPSTSIEAIIGHDAIIGEKDPTRLVVVIILAVILIIWAWKYETRRQNDE